MVSNVFTSIYIADFKIAVDGVQLTPSQAKRIMNLQVIERSDPPSQFSFQIYDPDLELIETKNGLLAEGREVEIEMGYVGHTRKMIHGYIVSLQASFPDSGPPSVDISGFDLSHRLTYGHYNQSSDGQTSDSPFRVSDLVPQIARGMDIEIDLPTPERIDPQNQVNMSNLAFLKKLAHDNGYLLWVEGAKLHFSKERPPANVIQLERGVNLVNFFPRLSLAGQTAQVEVRGWDRRQHKVIKGAAERSRNGLSDAGHDIITEGIHGPTVTRKIDAQVSTAEEAQTKARAGMDEQEQRLISGDGTSIGQPAMRVGTRLDLRGVGRFSGLYIVSEVTHTIGDGGYSTSFTVNQSSQLPAQSPIGDVPSDLPDLPAMGSGQGRFTSVVIGVVLSNEDSHGRGMIKIKLPGISDDENGHWARLATPDRGMFFLPDIDDEVLVAFENGDVNRPYILGVLWHDEAPPLRQREPENSVRELQSRSGHIFRFDDTEGGEKIEIIDTHGGHRIVLDSAERTISIVSDGSLEIQAADTLRLEGNHIEIIAHQDAEMTAGRETRLGQSSSMTRVQGQILHLN